MYTVNTIFNTSCASGAKYIDHLRQKQSKATRKEASFGLLMDARSLALPSRGQTCCAPGNDTRCASRSLRAIQRIARQSQVSQCDFLNRRLCTVRSRPRVRPARHARCGLTLEFDFGHFSAEPFVSRFEFAQELILLHPLDMAVHEQDV